MKKVLTLITLLTIVVMMLFGCAPQTKNGLDVYIEYYDYICSFELTNDLIYSDAQFLEEFKYTNGDFYYKDEFWTCTKALLYLSYDNETYTNAKNAVLENTPLYENEVYEFNGYVFYENLAMPIHKGNIDNEQNIRKYQYFNMVGYNDKKQTLFFLGAHISPENCFFNKEKRDLYTINSPEKLINFIVYEYSEWYSFN